MSEAIGMIETKGYTGSIEATDAMAKAANVTISKTIPIGGGLITVICRGDRQGRRGCRVQSRRQSRRTRGSPRPRPPAR
jgi:hypothetical protein